MEKKSVEALVKTIGEDAVLTINGLNITLGKYMDMSRQAMKSGVCTYRVGSRSPEDELNYLVPELAYYGAIIPPGYTRFLDNQPKNQ